MSLLRFYPGATPGKKETNWKLRWKNIYFQNTNSKKIIVLVYFKDRSSRMPIYVWDELYFFKGCYSIRITQWSREVIHRKPLFKEMSDLTGKNLAGPTTFSAYRSESSVKMFSLLRSGNNFLFVGPPNSVFKSRSFLQ
jgi:hypothetical protein